MTRRTLAPWPLLGILLGACGESTDIPDYGGVFTGWSALEARAATCYLDTYQGAPLTLTLGDEGGGVGSGYLEAAGEEWPLYGTLDEGFYTLRQSLAESLVEVTASVEGDEMRGEFVEVYANCYFVHSLRGKRVPE